MRTVFGIVGMTCLAVTLHAADPIISEFMAANAKSLADVDGDYSDWIEIYNPDTAPVSLNGWYLTDSATAKTKWKLPAISVPAGGYLLVFASGKNRTDPAAQLHTSFALDAAGGYLGLIKPDGVTAASEFAPAYPAQLDDVSYGITQPTAAGEAAQRGFFRSPTPLTRNGGVGSLLLLERVAFSRAPGPFTGTVTLAMTGNAAGQRIRYVIAGPSAAGATTTEPTASSTEYSAPLTISASTVVCASVFASDGVQRGFPTRGHYVRLATSGSARLDAFSSQLPVLVIDTHGSGPLVKDGLEHPAWIYAWDRPATGGTALTATPTAASSLTTNVRGASSSDFPKKSLALKLTDALGQSAPVAFFGLGKFDRWDLITAWAYDRTYLHNAFTYALSNRIGRWAPRTQLVEVFVNADGGDLDYSDYAGIYVFTDSMEIDSKRVDLASLAPTDLGTRSITGGYLLKMDLPDADEFSFQTNRDLPGTPFAVTVVQPKAAALAQAQRDYIKGYVQSFEDALFANYAGNFAQRTYADFISRGSFVDHHILNVLTQNVDAFIRSAYMTKDRDAKLAAGPMWDNDRAMDGGEVRTKNPEVWDGGAGATQLWVFGWWGPLARDPEFMQAWIDRWQALRRTEFSDASLTSLVDSLAAQVGTAAAARDAAQWPNTAGGLGNTPRFPNGWQGEVANMKSWLTRRTAWIDAQFTPLPTVTSSGGIVTLTPAAGTQIAYTTDGTDPRATGGAVASATKLSSTAVALADTADVQVRSYRASFNTDTVPGSAWSGRVGGPKSTPVSNYPAFSAQPVAQTVAAGSTVVFTAAANNSPNYQWVRNGAILPAATLGGNASTLVLPSVTADQAGTYWLNATNTSGASTSTPVALNVVSAADAGRLINLSVLTDLTATVPNFTLGTVVNGADSGATKALVVRAAGPALAAFGVPSPLSDPKLELYAGQTVIASNNDWENSAEITDAMARVGAFAYQPLSRDAALYRPALTPRDYTVAVSGVGGALGNAIAEIYDATPPSSFTPSTPRLINLSVLKQVAGNGTITLGFTIDGATAKTMLIRAIGPGLASVGVSGVMPDPKLTLFDSSSTAIAKNDDWDGNPAHTWAMNRVNAFAVTKTDSKDAMLLITLPRGGYTAQATAGNTGGYVIVEAYEVP